MLMKSIETLKLITAKMDDMYGKIKVLDDTVKELGDTIQGLKDEIEFLKNNKLGLGTWDMPPPIIKSNLVEVKAGAGEDYDETESPEATKVTKIGLLTPEELEGYS